MIYQCPPGYPRILLFDFRVENNRKSSRTFFDKLNQDQHNNFLSHDTTLVFNDTAYTAADGFLRVVS